MQQAMDYAASLDIPYVFSSNGKGLQFHDRTGASQTLEQTLLLDEFPDPEDLWKRYQLWKGLVPTQADGAAGLLRRRKLQGAALLSAQCYQCRSQRYRPERGELPGLRGDCLQPVRTLPDFLVDLSHEPSNSWARDTKFRLRRRTQRAHLHGLGVTTREYWGRA